MTDATKKRLSRWVPMRFRYETRWSEENELLFAEAARRRRSGPPFAERVQVQEWWEYRGRVSGLTTRRVA